MSKIQQEVQSILGDGEKVDPLEVSNFAARQACLFDKFSKLILDRMEIKEFSEEDRKFLEDFTELDKLQLNQTQIHSLANFPALPSLRRVSSFRC